MSNLAEAEQQRVHQQRYADELVGCHAKVVIQDKHSSTMIHTE